MNALSSSVKLRRIHLAYFGQARCLFHKKLMIEFGAN